VKRRLLVATLACGLALAPAVTRAQLSDKITLNGYSSMEFEKLLDDDGVGDPHGSLDADLFDLVLNITPAPRFRVAADLTWEHGTATEEGFGNVAIEYAFAEYDVKDWLKFRAGKMFTHFGIYNEIHTAKPAFLTVKEPLSTNKNEKFGSDLRFYPRWGSGLAVLGNGHASRVDFDYIVQLTNGAQANTNPFEEDDNAQKAVAARLRVSPTRGLSVGASLYSDRITEMNGDGEDGGGRTGLLSYGAQAAWTPGALGLEAEYVRGHLAPSSSARVRRWAATAMVYYRIRDRYTPYVRYEYLEPHAGIRDDQARMFVYGVNVRVAQGLYLKADLNTVRAGEANQRFEGGKFTEFKAAIAAGF
jgi:hypothetical protein